MRGLSALCVEFGFNFSNPVFRRSRISKFQVEVAKLWSASKAVPNVHGKLGTKRQVIRQQTKLSTLKKAMIGLATETAVERLQTRLSASTNAMNGLHTKTEVAELQTALSSFNNVITEPATKTEFNELHTGL
jgi:hypothetical protein